MKLKALKQPKKQKQDRSIRVDERLKEVQKIVSEADVNEVRDNESRVERFWKTRPRWKEPEVRSR